MSAVSFLVKVMANVNYKTHTNYQNFLPNGAPAESGSLTSGACVLLYKIEHGQIQICFQKRAEGISNGGYYDFSAGGHIDRGETPLAAAIREAKEEIGLVLSPDELIYLASWRIPDGSKIIHLYLSDRSNKNDTFALFPEEVESLEWIALEDLDTFIESKVKPPMRNGNLLLEAVRKFFKLI